jgi:hypothetical protein
MELKHTVSLKSGIKTMDRRLDRVDEKDPKSRNFSVATLIPKNRYNKHRSYTWRPGPTLNQRYEGACVGFAWAHELIARPASVDGISAKFAREEIYFRAQRHDRFPGGAYPDAFPFLEGTSVLGGAKAVHSLGYINEYRWAFDVIDLINAVGYMGPVVFGCSWTNNMDYPNEEGFINPTGTILGKHCILLYAVKIIKTENSELNLEKSYFTFQNSWGPEWGLLGSGKITFTNVKKLWDGAETCIPIGRNRFPLIVSKSNQVK